MIPPPAPKETTTPITTEVDPAKQPGAEDDDDKGPVPIGNGGKTDLYMWTQTLNELHLYLPVASSLRSKNVKVTFNLKHLKVVVDGAAIIDKDFPENINVEESLWTIEEGQI